MGTSFLLFRAFGIPVRVHWSFALILAYGAFAFSAGPAGPVLGAFYGLVVIVLLFACVTLHEFSHALVARRFEIGVRNITLLPIGGVANLERLPERPSQELLIAIAGPLMNFGLVLLLLPFVLWASALPSLPGQALAQLAAAGHEPGVLGASPPAELPGLYQPDAWAVQSAPCLPHGWRARAALAARYGVGLCAGDADRSLRRPRDRCPAGRLRHLPVERGRRRHHAAVDRLFRLHRRRRRNARQSKAGPCCSVCLCCRRWPPTRWRWTLGIH